MPRSDESRGISRVMADNQKRAAEQPFSVEAAMRIELMYRALQALA